MEIGIYKDSDFQAFIDGEWGSGMSCQEKRDKAIERVTIEIPEETKWGEY